MKILKVIALLIDYPDEALREYRHDLHGVINDSVEVPSTTRDSLAGLLDDIATGDLLDAQERYTGLFDRGRSLSLLLFEHVHGESRDRGQAMVDLMACYTAAGYHISAHELPDYIPLYLEFLSMGDEIDARVGLADVAHILAVIALRLKERGSSYQAAFDALLLISGAAVPMEEISQQVRQEEPDDTPEALDRLWEEQAVRFGAGENGECNTQSNAQGNANPRAFTGSRSEEQPLRWVQPSTQAKRAGQAKPTGQSKKGAQS